MPFFSPTSKDWNNPTFNPADPPCLDALIRKLRDDNVWISLFLSFAMFWLVLTPRHKCDIYVIYIHNLIQPYQYIYMSIYHSFDAAIILEELIRIDQAYSFIYKYFLQHLRKETPNGFSAFYCPPELVFTPHFQKSDRSKSLKTTTLLKLWLLVSNDILPAKCLHSNKSSFCVSYFFLRS